MNLNFSAVLCIRKYIFSSSSRAKYFVVILDGCSLHYILYAFRDSVYYFCHAVFHGILSYYDLHSRAKSFQNFFFPVSYIIAGTFCMH